MTKRWKPSDLPPRAEFLPRSMHQARGTGEEPWQAEFIVPVLAHCERLGRCRFFHVPNGGSRNKAEAARLKAMGVKPGVPDILVLFNHKGRPFVLMLEIKRPPWRVPETGKWRPKGRLSIDQEDWLRWLEDNGFSTAVIHEPKQFCDTLVTYGLLTDREATIIVEGSG